MLNVTDAALARMSQNLTRRSAPDEIALRLTAQGRHWRLRPDSVRADDTIFSHAGRAVLLLDPSSSTRLAQRTLDVGPNAEQRPRYRLRREHPRTD